MKPRLSVVVTAYNRKEFLLEALHSAVNQTLPRDSYEIICIKNFKDNKIDNYIKNQGIINVLKKQATLGEYLYIATKKSHGEIIVFLDDDDIFSKYKLERINYLFSKYQIGFYHNSSIKGEKFEDRFILHKDSFKIINPAKIKLKDIRIATFNLSSIAVKKDTLYKHINELREIIASQDSFMLLISLIEKSNIFIDNSKYTFYRLHNKNVSYPKSIEKHLKFNRKLELPALIYQLNLAKAYNSKAAKLVLKNLVFMTTSTISIEENNKKELIKAFTYIPFVMDKKLFKRVLLSILFLLGSNYPYKKLTRNFK